MPKLYMNIMPFYIRHLRIHSGLEPASYGHQGMRVHLYPIGSVSWGTVIYACLSLSVSGFVQCVNLSEIYESREIPFVNRIIYYLIIEIDCYTYSPKNDVTRKKMCPGLSNITLNL